MVSTMSVGYGARHELFHTEFIYVVLDHVDAIELGKRGLLLGYTPDVLNDAVADLSVMLALM